MSQIPRTVAYLGIEGKEVGGVGVGNEGPGPSIAGS